MAYSVNEDTKVATHDSETYPPTQKTNATTGETTLVAKTEAECIRVKALRDNAPALSLERLRQKRNSLLAQTDWIVAKSLEAGEAVPNAWKTYRQQLRDITTTYQSVSDDGFTWPTEPS
jgi:hypothetical protein